MLDSSTKYTGVLSSEESRKPQVISWKEGLLAFNDMTIAQVGTQHFGHGCARSILELVLLPMKNDGSQNISLVTN
jgi:hypothetical protein